MMVSNRETWQETVARIMAEYGSNTPISDDLLVETLNDDDVVLLDDEVPEHK